MLVYRVEDVKYHRGPYIGGYFDYDEALRAGSDIYDDYKVTGDSCQVHNTPDTDFHGEKTSYSFFEGSPAQGLYDLKYRCAFYNLNNLLEWFPCEVGREHMGNVGFRIVVLEVQRFWGLMSQIMFDPVGVKLIETRDIRTFELC